MMDNLDNGCMDDLLDFDEMKDETTALAVDILKHLDTDSSEFIAINRDALASLALGFLCLKEMLNESAPNNKLH